MTDEIEGHDIIEVEPVAFSDRLVPAASLKLPEVAAGSMGLYSRGTRTYFTWVAQAPATITLKVQAGRIYDNRGPAKIALFAAADATGKPIAHAQVPPDKKEHQVELKTTISGLHRLVVDDQAAGTVTTWIEGTPMTVASSPEQPAALHGRWSLYFYVPKGTQKVGGFSSSPGQLLDGDGKLVQTFTARGEYFNVPVPAGQDGRLWKFHNCLGPRLLMTVPPYMARNAQELLLPEEVVAKDAKK